MIVEHRSILAPFVWQPNLGALPGSSKESRIKENSRHRSFLQSASTGIIAVEAYLHDQPSTTLHLWTVQVV